MEVGEIRLGNIIPQEFNRYLGITLSEEHLKLFKETHRKAANGIYGEREWHMFRLPLVLEVGSKAFAEELISILNTYEIKGQLAVVWPIKGDENGN